MVSVVNYSIATKVNATMIAGRNNYTLYYPYDDDLNMETIWNMTNFTRQQPQPPPADFYDPRHHQQSSVGVLVLAVLLVVLSVLLTILVLHILRYRLMRRLVALQHHHQPQPPERSAMDAIKRYAVIEEWLISKRVLKHDDACSRILKAGQRLSNGNGDNDSQQSQSAGPSDEDSARTPSSSEQSLQANESQDVTSSDDNACPICISPFLTGEIVSCSADEQCNHIYHHECIKEWLLNHSECPFCRNVFLEVDKAADDIQQVQHLTTKKSSPQQLSKRAQLAYCCTVHGLVELSPLLCRQATADLVTDIETKVRGEQTLIQRGDLIVKRGARHVQEVKEQRLVDESSIVCLASRSGDSPSRKRGDADDGDDLEANLRPQSPERTQAAVAAHQYLI